MSHDDFLSDILANPDDPRRRRIEMRLALEPSLSSADYPTYTCRECAKPFRGPICGHCGARNFDVGPDLAAWPVSGGDADKR